VRALAGAAVVLNSHVWHGGTRNQTGALRRVLQCYFVQPGYATQLKQRDYLRPETDRRLTPQLRRLLDV
jgi:ectoine hydroxylase-related dioxygenase (phytanoyl-CoA dioxygenase family)